MSALIDVDQLRTFIAIVETGSFTKAAEVVHKTQSAVSMQMKRLEERLGQADLRARRPRLQAHRGRRAAARLRAPHHQAQRRGARRLRRRRAHRPRAARPAGRLRRPLSAGDHGAVLARLSGRRAHRDVRAVGRTGRADRRQRARSRHRHRLRHIARLRDVPPRAAAVGRRRTGIRPIWKSRCRSRSDGRAAAGGAPRSSAWRRSAGRTTSSTPAPTPARWPPPCCRGWRFRCFRNSGCGPACACSIRPTAFPNCRGCRVGLIRNPHESLALADALAEHIISSLDNLSEAAQAAE